MKWNNLIENKCPRCAKRLGHNLNTATLVCRCSFKITEEKFSKICMDINNNRNVKKNYDNQEELNNL